MPPTTRAGGWSLNQQGACKGMLDNDGQANGLKATVVQTDGQDWHMALASPPVQLSDGISYTMTFVARASAPMRIDYDSKITQQDYHSTGLSGTVNLTTTWHKYRATFRASQCAGLASCFSFDIGYSTGSYWISSVRLVEGAPAALAADSADPINWGLEIDAGDQAKMVRDGNALKVVILQVDGTNWHVQLYQSGISLVEGQTYEVSFDMKADRLIDEVLNAETMSTYSNAGLGVTIHLAPSWQHISYTFKAQNIKGELSRVPDFDLAYQTGVVWIKNATLEPVD